MHIPPDATVAVLVSGGLDSCILAWQLLELGNSVQPIYVRSGLAWEASELTALRGVLAATGRPGLMDLAVLDLPLGDLYANHWSLTGKRVPDRASADEAVYLPGRNPLLLIKPALWCRLQGIDRLALAVLESNPFSDATPEFFRSFEAMMNLATGGRLEILRPFSDLSKQQVMQLGARYPLDLTFSCIAPVNGRHCGQCNKCAERQTAFRAIERKDSTRYAIDARS